MAIVRGDPPEDDEPVFIIPEYAELWNASTTMPAGKLFFSPIGGDYNPSDVGGRSPLDVQPVPGGKDPEYDGVWEYKCSDISMPHIVIEQGDVDLGARSLTTGEGTVGEGIEIIIKLIKVLLNLDEPCSDKDIENAVEALKELINELSSIGITLGNHVKATPEYIKENLCSDPWMTHFRFMLMSLETSMKEFFPSPGRLPNLNNVMRPWTYNYMGTTNCKWVFMGYYKRGEKPSGNYGTPITPPPTPDPAAPNVEIRVGETRMGNKIDRIRGNGETNQGKKYTLKNRRATIGLFFVGAGFIPTIGVKI